MHARRVKDHDKVLRVLDIFEAALPLLHDPIVLSQEHQGNSEAKKNYKALRDAFSNLPKELKPPKNIMEMISAIEAKKDDDEEEKF